MKLFKKGKGKGKGKGDPSQPLTAYASSFADASTISGMSAEGLEPPVFPDSPPGVPLGNVYSGGQSSSSSYAGGPYYSSGQGATYQPADVRGVIPPGGPGSSTYLPASYSQRSHSRQGFYNQQASSQQNVGPQGYITNPRDERVIPTGGHGSSTSHHASQRAFYQHTAGSQQSVSQHPSGSRSYGQAQSSGPYASSSTYASSMSQLGSARGSVETLRFPLGGNQPNLYAESIVYPESMATSTGGHSSMRTFRPPKRSVYSGRVGHGSSPNVGASSQTTNTASRFKNMFRSKKPQMYSSAGGSASQAHFNASQYSLDQSTTEAPLLPVGQSSQPIAGSSSVPSGHEVKYLEPGILGPRQRADEQTAFKDFLALIREDGAESRQYAIALAGTLLASKSGFNRPYFSVLKTSWRHINLTTFLRVFNSDEQSSLRSRINPRYRSALLEHKNYLDVTEKFDLTARKDDKNRLQAYVWSLRGIFACAGLDRTQADTYLKVLPPEVIQSMLTEFRMAHTVAESGDTRKLRRQFSMQVES